jgi:hypothetical protein
MRIHIEDLEAIKEMNEEIEEGHVEAEKELQETIGEPLSGLQRSCTYLTRLW